VILKRSVKLESHSLIGRRVAAKDTGDYVGRRRALKAAVRRRISSISISKVGRVRKVDDNKILAILDELVKTATQHQGCQNTSLPQ
jgi:hypothetical protein